MIINLLLQNRKNFRDRVGGIKLISHHGASARYLRLSRARTEGIRVSLDAVLFL